MARATWLWQNSRMTKTVKVRRVGKSYGLMMSKELLEELGFSVGDVFIPVRTADGLRLMRYDPDLAEALEASRDFMRRHAGAMRALAKR